MTQPPDPGRPGDGERAAPDAPALVPRTESPSFSILDVRLDEPLPSRENRPPERKAETAAGPDAPPEQEAPHDESLATDPTPTPARRFLGVRPARARTSAARWLIAPGRRAFLVVGIGSSLSALSYAVYTHLRHPPADLSLAPGEPDASANEPDALTGLPEPSSPAPAHEAPLTPPFRVHDLSSDANVKLVEGEMGAHSFVDTLLAKGVPRAQVYRLLSAFAPVRNFDRTHKGESFAVALDRKSLRIRAFEYTVSKTEVYQARESESGPLAGQKLDLHVAHQRLIRAITVEEDLASSLKSAGLDASILDLLDDALEGRTQLSSLHPGARLRLIADEETSMGTFARYAELCAVEYIPAGKEGVAIRVYHYGGKGARGYFDAKGKQPFTGGFRTPVPFARVSSRFNMRRMHPVLHIIKPHTGVDFAASTGTAVYAAAAGVVERAAESGPSGRLVTIDHEGGLKTGYAHLSRFAPGLHSGQHVEGRQLIGYVGSTGRSTGPHLHFSAKKNGTFIDPLTLKLDGEKVLPKGDREPFEHARAELDQALDSVPLPPASHWQQQEPPGTSDLVEEQDPLSDEEADSGSIAASTASATGSSGAPATASANGAASATGATP